MQEPYRMEKITVLVADGSLGQCMELEVCGRMQKEIEICAVVQSAERVLELLRGGLRPRVLVLDTVLPGGGLLRLLQDLPVELPDYDPCVLVTSVQVSARLEKILLTLGVADFILKPYKTEELFEKICLFGCAEDQQDLVFVRRHVYRILQELCVGLHSRGVRYLEQIVCLQLFNENGYSMGEAYNIVCAREQLSPHAIVSGVHRVAERAWKAQAPAYAFLCKCGGKAEGTHLTNTEFVTSIVNYVRQAMRW